GFIGVTLQPIDSNLAQSFHLIKVKGALVSNVAPDSPAQKAGLQQGDVILAYEDKEVATISSLRNAIAFMKPGSQISLKILREGREMQIPLTIGEYPDAQETA